MLPKLLCFVRMVMHSADNPALVGNVLTLTEAASLVRVPVSTAKSLARMGKFPGAFKIGSMWRVNGDVLALAIAGTALEGGGCIAPDLSSVKE